MLLFSCIQNNVPQSHYTNLYPAQRLDWTYELAYKSKTQRETVLVKKHHMQTSDAKYTQKTYLNTCLKYKRILKKHFYSTLWVRDGYNVMLTYILMCCVCIVICRDASEMVLTAIKWRSRSIEPFCIHPMILNTFVHCNTNKF